MVKSMTSFGRAALNFEKREYLIEIRTVNHKYNDITFKMDKSLYYLEDELRKKILTYISRGKVEVYIDIKNYEEKVNNIVFNKELIKAYVNQLNEIAEENNIKNDISIMQIIKLPDAIDFKCEENVITEELMQCLTNALDNVMEMRAIEGEKISQDIISRIKTIENNIQLIQNKSDELLNKYRIKLAERVEELCEGNKLDDVRLAQEVVIYADKTSINEELTRLNSHCNQFRLTLKENGNIGKDIACCCKKIGVLIL